MFWCLVLVADGSQSVLDCPECSQFHFGSFPVGGAIRATNSTLKATPCFSELNMNPHKNRISEIEFWKNLLETFFSKVYGSSKRRSKAGPVDE
jgi:hypothetical protein